MYLDSNIILTRDDVTNAQLAEMLTAGVNMTHTLLFVSFFSF